MDDLETMVRKGDPQVVRWALKKCLHLEHDPNAGEQLRGPLIGYRKLTVGDRDWRVVWRVTHDDSGRVVVDVAEVWAIGARSDSEVYEEMERRVASLAGGPTTVPLAEVVERLGNLGRGIEPSEEDQGLPPASEIPAWLTAVLTNVVRMPAAEVQRLNGEQALAVWQAFASTTK